MNPLGICSLLAVLCLSAASLDTRKVFACGRKLGCKEYSPLPLPAAPNGSWSGRLHTGSRWSSRCYSESDWRKAATEECGAEPTLYRVGVHCGEQRHKFVEVVFVCDRPKKRLSPDPWTVEPEREERYRAQQHEILQKIANLSRELDRVTKDGRIEPNEQTEVHFFLSYQTLYLKLTANLMDLGPSRRRDPIGYACYDSQDTVMAKVHAPTVHERPLHLLRSVADCLMYRDRNITSRGAFDKDYYVGGKDFNKMLDSAAAFPELKPQITRLFVENLQKHSLGFAPENLGFLGERCAERQLRKMYEEVFTVGHFDRKYLTNTQRV